MTSAVVVGLHRLSTVPWSLVAMARRLDVMPIVSEALQSLVHRERPPRQERGFAPVL